MTYLYLLSGAGRWHRFDYLAPINHVRAYARILRSDGMTAFASRSALAIPSSSRLGVIAP